MGVYTSAAEVGADVLHMRKVSRHKRVEPMQGYVRRVNGFEDHAGEKLLSGTTGFVVYTTIPPGSVTACEALTAAGAA